MRYHNKRDSLGEEVVVDHREGVEVDQVADPEVAQGEVEEQPLPHERL